MFDSECKRDEAASALRNRMEKQIETEMIKYASCDSQVAGHTVHLIDCIELAWPNIHSSLDTIPDRKTGVQRLLVAGPITVQIQPEERIPLDGPESQPTVLMVPPGRVRLGPFSVLMRWPVHCAASILRWWSEVGEICLPVGAVVLQDGEEAGDPVELPVRPVVCPLWRVVPVVVDIEFLTGSIAHELGGTYLVDAVSHYSAQKVRCPAQNALYGRILEG